MGKELEKLGLLKQGEEKMNEQDGKRADGRLFNQPRKITIEPDYIKNADGSCLVSFGETKVICTAMLGEDLPLFAKEKGIGWITSEYAMIPGSTLKRKTRDRNKVDGRSVEIQRLIGRSVRAGIDLNRLRDFSLYIDADVINADGGTRTASITGGFVAAALAFKKFRNKGYLKNSPIRKFIAALSVGLVDGRIFVDLNYEEDEKAHCDMNVVAADDGELVDITANSGGATFKKTVFDKMLAVALEEVIKITELQKSIVGVL